ncbi:MAG: Mur ligase family protein [Candidatus Paceibacterota bacterium]
MNLQSVKKPYFLGIGGIGVSAIARMMIHEGKAVSGSDTANSDLLEELRKAGASITIGNDLSHIPEDADLIVYSIAVPHYASDFFKSVKGKFSNVLSYPEVLSIVSKDKYTIAIAGTHGKTTTTAMVAKIMMDQGLDPTVIVGSILKDAKTNFIAGKSKYLVVEACEYCRSFLEINPTVVGLTTIDNDHMDYYKDADDIMSAFKEFVAKIPEGGAVVGNQSDVLIAKASEGAIIIDSDKYFDPTMKLLIPGEHNRRNASVALAIADHLGIPKEKAIESVKNFSGTWRRFEYKGKTKGGAIVYDDYGHHPTEIAATLSGARELYPDKKITIIFQPHLYSRTKLLFNDFVDSLSKADYVMLAPIYFAREEADPSISSELLAGKIKEKNENVLFFETFKEIKKAVLECSSENDVIIVMGAGDITEVGDMLIDGK